MSVLIKGGRVITAADDYVGDVLVEGERISLIGESLDVEAERVIDASGKYVLPGCVDPHTHLDMPFGGTVTADDFESGHTAAAFGGTTTHVDFCIQPQGRDLRLRARDLARQGERERDHRLRLPHRRHRPREGGTLEELAALPDDQGVTSYKLFMAYKGALMVDDETLYRAMEVASRSGALVMVHAENGDVIDILVREALEAGNTDPVYHALTRPPEVEGEATNRAIQLAHLAGSPLYVVHVTCREAVEPIAAARGEGLEHLGRDVHAVLLQLARRHQRSRTSRARSTSTRRRCATSRTGTCSGTRSGADALSVISTDHCAFTWGEQKAMGRDDFSKIPNGGPGLENRLHMIHEFGVRSGRLTLNRMVELLATNPAKLFGLYPRKGTIAVGSDADIVVFDPEQRHLITAAGQHSKSDYNLYEGTEVTGTPELVLRRGEVLVENGQLVARPGSGQFIRRARFGQELRATAVHAGTREAHRPGRGQTLPLHVHGLTLSGSRLQEAARVRLPEPRVERVEGRQAEAVRGRDGVERRVRTAPAATRPSSRPGRRRTRARRASATRRSAARRRAPPGRSASIVPSSRVVFTMVHAHAAVARLR